MLDHEGTLFTVRDARTVKPGKGGAYVQTELKGVRVNTKLNVRFRSSDTVEKAELGPSVEYQFLYAESQKLNFMNAETFEQVCVSV